MTAQCPNCKCTNRAMTVKTEKIDRNYDTLYREECVCGCGCHFVVVFKPVEIYKK